MSHSSSGVRPIHVMTPGDHFSPRTGSAIATVIHGLCSHEHGQRAAVAVARGTYPDRYSSADIIEYEQAREPRLPPRVSPGMIDAGLARLGLPRLMARMRLEPVVRELAHGPPGIIFCHNSPQLASMVDTGRHRAFLYAHNDVLKTYSIRETHRALDRIAGIVCVSNFLAEQTRMHTPAPMHERIRVVHNGVDLDLFERVTPLRSSDDLRVVFVARMIHDKGPDIVIDALRKLGRSDIHLTLVGSQGFDARTPITEYERQIRRKAAELGDRVSIYPFLPRIEVARILASSDVLVVPSRWAEPFALTVREGQAAGLAVVAADVGGIPEALGGHGRLVPPDDPVAVADALADLASDEASLRSCGAAARAFAEQNDWSLAASRLKRVTDELTS